MPVTIRRIGPGDHFMVSTPNGVKAHDTTMKNAQAMKRILDAYERKQRIKAKQNRKGGGNK